jgi:predicted nucleic acid-binding protein
MVLTVLLDANVRVNAAVRDTLLRCAAHGMYRLVLSRDFVDEMQRALESQLGRTREQTVRLIAEINGTFVDAFVEDYEALIPHVANSPTDRDVLAAAVKARVDIIVTFNIRDFPMSACAPYGGQVSHPDDFLQELWVQSSRTMTDMLRRQAHDLKDWSFDR